MFSAADLPRPTATYRSEPYPRLSDDHGFTGQGKTILITGGAGGIGMAIAEAFAEAQTSRIVLVGRTQDSLIAAKTQLEDKYPNTQVVTYAADITDSAKMTQIVHEIASIDVLVLNAAVAHRRVKASDTSIAEVSDAFSINTIAQFHLIATYLNLPMDGLADGKTVLNVSAFAAYMYGASRVGYGPSKAATAQMVQLFAEERKDENVKLISFHPGSIYTDGVAKNIPKDMLTWDDVKLPGHFARWLAGPQSGFLNGRFVWANWDVDELLELKDRMEKDKTFLTIGLVV